MAGGLVLAQAGVGLGAVALTCYLVLHARTASESASAADTIVRIVAMYGVLGVAILLTTIAFSAVLPGGGSPVIVGAILALILSLAGGLWAGGLARSRSSDPPGAPITAALGVGLGHILMLDVIAAGLLVGVALFTSLPVVGETLARLSPEAPGLQLAALLGVLIPAAVVAAASAYLGMEGPGP